MAGWQRLYHVRTYVQMTEREVAAVLADPRGAPDSDGEDEGDLPEWKARVALRNLRLCIGKGSVEDAHWRRHQRLGVSTKCIPCWHAGRAGLHNLTWRAPLRVLKPEAALLPRS